MTWRLVRSYGLLLIVFLFALLMVQLVGLPGAPHGGLFFQARSATLDSLEHVSGLLGQRISSWYGERRIDIDGLASSPLFRRAVERRDPAVDVELASFLRSHPGVETVTVRDASGVAERYRLRGYAETVEIHDEVEGESRLRIVRQLFSPEDPARLIGILFAECRIGEALLPILASVDVLRTHQWDCLIVDPRGRPVLLFQDNPQPEPAAFEALRGALGGIEGPYDGPDQVGRPVLAFARQVALGGGLSLALVLSADQRQAYLPAVNEVIRLLLLWGLVFLAGIGVSVFLARQISRPVRELVSMARRIDAGDLEARAMVTDRTELGQLAEVFNTMVTRLQSRHEDQIRHISNNITGGMIYQAVTDVDGSRRFSYLSDSVRQLYGCTPEAAMADSRLIYGRVLDEDKQGLLEKEQTAIATLTPFHAETRILDPSGEVRWSSMVSSPTPLEDGSVCWDGIEFVITDQKRAEERMRNQLEEIREKEAQFHNLADSGLALIWTAGTDKLCSYFNAPWLKFTGRSLEQEHGNGWVEGVHSEDVKACFETYNNAFDRREPFEMEYRLRNHEGEYRWITDMGTPNYNHRGEFVGYIGHCYDITDKKKMLDTLQRNDKLESLGVLAGGIAHDFNNLLAGLFAYLQLAREASKADPVTARHLDKALGAFHRAKDLTRQLLTFSKGGEPTRTATALAPLLEETTRFALSGSPIVCTFEFDADLRPCDIDANQIGQVVDNLVINAIQAMPLGGTLRVGAHNHISPRGDAVEIRFTDTGMGIPAQVLPRIFDPFFTTKQHGTGLGLATSYSIVQKHGGTIDVESAPGKGTTFRIELPASLERPAVGDAPAREHRGTGTIVVMDDEDLVRELAGEWLEGMGYTVVAMHDGDETLRYFARLGAGSLPVAVFLDLTIPGGRGGAETVAQLRQRWPELHVFASSGYSDDPVMARPTEFGFTGSIAKPYLRDELASLLNRYGIE